MIQLRGGRGTRRGRRALARPIPEETSFGLTFAAANQYFDEDDTASREDDIDAAPLSIIAAAATASAARASRSVKARDQKETEFIGKSNTRLEATSVDNEAGRKLAKTTNVPDSGDQRREVGQKDEYSTDILEPKAGKKQSLAPVAGGVGAERTSRYIAKLVEHAAFRKDLADAVAERRLIKEQGRDAEEFGDKEQFVTSAYKRKLASRRVWEEAEHKRELEDAKNRIAVKGRKAITGGIGRDLLRRQVGGKSRHESAPRYTSRLREDETEPTVDASGLTNEAAENDVAERLAEPAIRKRGLRRNDERSIAAYRERYFERSRLQRRGAGELSA